LGRVIDNAEFNGVISQKSEKSPLFYLFNSALSVALKKSFEVLRLTKAARCCNLQMQTNRSHRVKKRIHGSLAGRRSRKG
jgi:hypothetical protein